MNSNDQIYNTSVSTEVEKQDLRVAIFGIILPGFQICLDCVKWLVDMQLGVEAMAVQCSFNSLNGLLCAKEFLLAFGVLVGVGN